MLVFGTVAACLPVTAGSAVPAGSAWQVATTAEGEVWRCEGDGAAILAAMQELTKVAETPVVFDAGNLGSTRVAGRTVRVELAFRG